MDTPSELHPIAEAMIEDISIALRRFGEYTYCDKGPREVMDLDHWVDRIHELPVDLAQKILLQVAANSRSGEQLVSDILIQSQEWDELFENEELAELM